MKATTFITAISSLFLLVSYSLAITIETVPVGNPGNPPDIHQSGSRLTGLTVAP